LVIGKESTMTQPKPATDHEDVSPIARARGEQELLVRDTAVDGAADDAEDEEATSGRSASVATEGNGDMPPPVAGSREG
jgi:hypothetical protein